MTPKKKTIIEFFEQGAQRSDTWGENTTVEHTGATTVIYIMFPSFLAEPGLYVERMGMVTSRTFVILNYFRSIL